MKQALRRPLRQAVSLLVLDGLLFCGTDVTKVPSPVVIAGFLLLIATLYLLVRTLLKVGRLYGLNFRRQKRLSLYLTGLIGGLVALQSIGQLGQRDILVLLPLSVLAYFYVASLKAGGRDLSG